MIGEVSKRRPTPKTDLDHARPFARRCTDAELAAVVLRAASWQTDRVVAEQLREAASRLDPQGSAA